MTPEQEIEQLKERLARFEKADADRRDPNVLLLEGRLNRYEGDYSATGVLTGTGNVYLAEVIEDLLGWRGNIATFQYHVCSEPKSFYELEEALVKEVMGEVRADFSHAYSDLTGYLWTNEKVKVQGHDLLEELLSMAKGIDKPYIALRVEKKED